MEEKTPVGSNAPIEESTEKKTSPAGSNSPSPAPAGSSSASPASIEESADAAEAASTDASVESAGAEETASADEASAAEAVPDGEEDENAQWEAYEREQAEIEESRRKPGKYRWVMKQDDMREAMLALEKAKGRYRMYTIAAYVMCVFALVPAADFILTRSVFSMMAAFAAAGLGIWIKGITSRAARGAMKQMNPRGIKFSIEAKKHGLQVSDMVNKASLMPYSFFKAAYETEDYPLAGDCEELRLCIQRDEGVRPIGAPAEKLQRNWANFMSKKIQKNK